MTGEEQCEKYCFVYKKGRVLHAYDSSFETGSATETYICYWLLPSGGFGYGVTLGKVQRKLFKYSLLSTCILSQSQHGGRCQYEGNGLLIKICVQYWGKNFKTHCWSTIILTSQKIPLNFHSSKSMMFLAVTLPVIMIKSPFQNSYVGDTLGFSYGIAQIQSLC